MSEKRLKQSIRVGTRASPLALAQTAHVAAALCAAHDWSADRVTKQEIITEGDRRLEARLADIGGKGLFTEELEAGLLDGDLDFAVHSLKDLPTAAPDGLTLAAILPRAPAHDVLVPHPDLARRAAPLEALADMPQGARIGTSALRRHAQILHARPDIEIVALRGNVGTRLQKLETDGLDGIVLAAAGLTRLGIAPKGGFALVTQTMLPSAGQGALAVQCRSDADDLKTLLAVLHCPQTATCVAAERSFLAALDGSCRTPIAAHATLDAADKTLNLHGRWLADDGAWMAAASDTQALDTQALDTQAIDTQALDMQKAEKLGRDLAARVRLKAEAMRARGPS